MVQGSGFAVSTWGHQAIAISELRLRSLETDALACTGTKPGGRCRTTAFMVAYGLQGSPRAMIHRETIRAYFDVLRAASQEGIADIRSAWPKARDFLIGKKLNVLAVHGVMSNVIYILLHAKWFPRTYNLLEDCNGAQWQIVDWHVSPDIVAAAVTESFFSHDVVRAAEHYNGKGIKHVVDTDNTLRYIRNIKTKSDVNY